MVKKTAICGTICCTRATDESNGVQVIRHKIGCTRTVKTAVMVTAYLNARYPYPPSRFVYHFTDAIEHNGWWSADIICLTYDSEDIDKLFPEIVGECRAFVAGAGEIWT